MRNFFKSLSRIETPLKVVRYSQSLCGVPKFRSPTGDVVLVVVDVVPIWIETPHNGLVASLLPTISLLGHIRKIVKKLNRLSWLI